MKNIFYANKSMQHLWATLVLVARARIGAMVTRYGTRTYIDFAYYRESTWPHTAQQLSNYDLLLMFSTGVHNKNAYPKLLNHY